MFVVPLTTPLELVDCGGKAWNLRRLANSGWNVPPGWVVTNLAFEEYRRAREARPSEADATPVPESVVAALNATLIDAPRGLLAVRSSAVGEDSPHAAFAGQLETVLNVPPTLDDVLAAVRRCWLSYWSDRVSQYQIHREVTLRGMGVIVQRMVDARISGVMFTRHPSPRPRQAEENAVLIEYCEGLGEALVAGNVTPQRCLVPRHKEGGPLWESSHIDSLAPLTMESARLTARQIQTLATAAERLEQFFGAPQDVEWSSDQDGNIHWLQSRPITTRINSPAPEILSREADHSAAKLAGATQRWTNANLNENYPEPVSPLLESIARESYRHYFRNLGVALGIRPERIATVETRLRFLVGLHAGRLYYNLSNIREVIQVAPFGDWLVKSFLDFVGADEDGGGGEANADHGTSVKGAPAQRTEHKGRRSSPSDPTAEERMRDAWDALRVAGRAWWLYSGMRSGVESFEKVVDELARVTERRRLDDATPEELLGYLREFRRIRMERWLPASVADAASMVTYGLLKAHLSREFPGAEQASLHNRLLRGLREIVSAGPADSLWNISRLVRGRLDWREAIQVSEGERAWERIQQDPALVELRELIQRWLDEWGFRCSGELLLTVPSYQEQPEAALQLLQTYVRLEGESPAQRLQDQETQRRRETESILRTLRSRRLVSWLPWPRRAGVTRRLLDATQSAIICRERARWKQALLYQRLRAIALAIGKRLVQWRVLARPDDVFQLTFDEVESILEGGSALADTALGIVAARRATRDRLAGLEPPRDLWLRRGERWRVDDGVERDNREISVIGGGDRNMDGDRDEGARDQLHGVVVLRGTGASGGSVEGSACVLNSVLEMNRLRPGDILVARQTDPGWSTIFPLIRGLVMERGGMLSHGAILAREYGLPTVVDVAEATSRLAGRPLIRVDGDRGEIRAEIVAESIDDGFCAETE